MQKTLLSVVALCVMAISIWAYTNANYPQPEASPDEVIEVNIPILDVVRDVPPVWASNKCMALVDKLRATESVSEKEKIMDEEGREVLTPYIAAYLRGKGYECFMNPIEFYFGSGTSENVSSGDGKYYAGLYDKELYAKITGGECFGEGLVVYAACSNLTLYRLLKPETEIVLGSGTEHMKFTVQEGAGFDLYTQNFETSIDLAEYFNLPVYAGKSWSKKSKITYAEARSRVNSLPTQQVTIGNIFPGDVVDLGNMTINGLPANSQGIYRS